MGWNQQAPRVKQGSEAPGKDTLPQGSRYSLGSITGTPPAVVHTLRETSGSRVRKMLKSLTKKKKSVAGCEATRCSSSGSAFLIPGVMPSQGPVACGPSQECSPPWLACSSA